VSIDLPDVAHAHRLRKGRRLTGLRRHLISRVCALSIITLILLPFTAPFKTYGLAGSSSRHAHDGLPKHKIDADQKLAGLSKAPLVVPAPDIVGLEPFSRHHQIQERQLRATILRI
jgi:hypothetical protein